MSELHLLNASRALEKLKAREITALDLTTDCLRQIKSVDPVLRAWVTVSPEMALHQAAAVDAQIDAGKPLGALSGIPVGVKDIFNTRDFPTQMGSPIWQGFTPGNDARVVHYLRMAGAVIPGKTVTAEFAVHTPGPTGNPHNPAYMPGTSSSGSAVAVAAYMVPLALGTQTAGSTIRPASYCGVYGFKPSFGLFPRTGMLKTTDTLDTVGFFARDVNDLAILFEVMRVRGLDYPLIERKLSAPAHRERPNGRPWRIALVRGPKWDYAETHAQRALYEFAARLQTDSEFDLHDVELPSTFSRAHEIHGVIYDRTLAYYFKNEFQQHTLVSPTMYEIIRRGNEISLAQYQQALDAQVALAQELDAFFANRFDVILNLATGGEALYGLDSLDRPDNCLVWTLCGVPAINLPIFVGPNGLPFGAQIVARRYSDYLLLAFAYALAARGLIPTETFPIPALTMRPTWFQALKPSTNDVSLNNGQTIDA